MTENDARKAFTTAHTALQTAHAAYQSARAELHRITGEFHGTEQALSMQFSAALSTTHSDGGNETRILADY